jgi:hypothetical protein
LIWHFGVDDIFGLQISCHCFFCWQRTKGLVATASIASSAAAAAA